MPNPMSYSVEHNLPIFSKSQVVPFNGKYFINASVGSDSYLGCMRTSPRKDYYAFITNFNEKEGIFRIGRLDYRDILSKKIEEGSTKVLIEVIPNRYGSILDNTEFVPKMQFRYLSFIKGEIKMDFFDWVKFFNEKIKK